MRKVALLRGINVGGKNTIKMDALKAMFESLGFANVATYIQSGNVVYESDSCHDDDKARIERAIGEAFGFEVAVLVLSQERVAEIVAQSPYGEGKATYFALLFSPPDETFHTKLENIAQADEQYALKGDVVHLHYPNGYGTSKLTNNVIESKLKVKATTRNYATMEKLINIV